MGRSTGRSNKEGRGPAPAPERYPASEGRADGMTGEEDLRPAHDLQPQITSS